MKTRQTSDAASTTPATKNTNSSAPPQTVMTSSSPNVKKRPTIEERKARYRENRNLLAHPRDIVIKREKTIKQGGAAGIQHEPEHNSTAEKFSHAVREGRLSTNDVLVENVMRELAVWLPTSPDSLRELWVFSLDDSSDDAIMLAEALLENTTLNSLVLFVGPECAVAMSEVWRGNSKLPATLTSIDFLGHYIGASAAAALADTLRDNSTLKTLNLRKNSIGDDGIEALAEALKFNRTLISLDLRENCISEVGAAMLAEALRFNKSLTKINLSFNRINEDGALALLDALEVNTTLTELDHDYCNISFPLWKKFSDLLERNKRLKLMPYAEASLDLLVRHSPALKNMGFPTDVIPVLAEQLPNEVLAVFGQEWQEIFRAPPPPITTTTTNTTTTTTTTTTTDSTVPTTLTTLPAATATSPTSAPPLITQPTATAAEINALLANLNPVAAISRWIDRHANPVAALNWVDPSNGYTLLHYAVEAQQGAVVRSLLARGIDRTRADQTNQTAAQLAQQRADSSSSSAVAAIAALFK